MDDVLTQLARIETQNLEILALLTARKANKRFLPVDEAAERLDRSPWTIGNSAMPAKYGL